MSGWNSTELWRNLYGPPVSELLFFAEDTFGEQFAVRNDTIVRLNPESGEPTFHSNGIDGWAARILNDYRFETGQPLALAWQRANGPIGPGRRLLPQTPFVLGGACAINNLYDGDAVQGMRFRADLASQLRSIPDGASVRLVVTE